MSPHFFLLGFVFGEVSKPNMTFVTFCVKSFSCYMLHIAMLMLKHSLVWYHWFWYFYKFYFKNGFSILQVSRDRKRLLTASVRHLSSVVYCQKVAFLKQWSLTTAHVRDHSTDVICFVQKRWLICFNVTVVVTYSETDSVELKDASVAYNVRVTFSGKSLRSFCRKQTAALLWRLSFKMGSFAKDCLQPLVNRISTKTLEKYWPSHILSISSKLKDLTRNWR